MRQNDEREDVRGTWARTKLLGISRLRVLAFQVFAPVLRHANYE